MSSQSSVPLGLEALKQGHYSEAIELLEKLCQLNKVNSEPALKEYMAQIGLVKAYHGNGQQEKAIALCQQLTRSNNPQVQAWAQKALQSLLTVKVEFSLPHQTEQQTVLDKQFLTSQQADELLKSGNKALKLKHYPQAVATLEEFCRGTKPSTKNYSQAQMWLVKAYKGNEQLEEAIALCQQLTTSEQQVLQIWAKQFLLTLVPLEALQKETETQQDNQSPNASDLITTKTDKAADVGIKMKTLSEFKVFYQKTLLHDLKVIELNRQQIVQQITVVGIIILLLISLLLKFFPTNTLNFSSLQAAKSSVSILFVFLLAFVGCIWFWVVFYSSSTEMYAKGFKTNIIQKIINFIDSNNFSYSQYAETHTTLTAFKHSQLFQSIIAPSKISQDNCITGRVGETDIFFSEICVEIEVTHQ